jgi:hypothetical protein
MSRSAEQLAEEYARSKLMEMPMPKCGQGKSTKAELVFFLF